ncbi:MAG: hypothetical protein ACRDQX_12735, partial [Pseudonocardiaceae bacterium]
PGTARPHASPGAALDGAGACVVWFCPGLACGSPGGRSMGCPTLPSRSNFLWRAIPEICPPGEGIVGWSALRLEM